MWYKKQGGAVIKSIDLSTVKSINLIESARPLVYVPLKNMLMLPSDADALKGAPVMYQVCVCRASLRVFSSFFSSSSLLKK